MSLMTRVSNEDPDQPGHDFHCSFAYCRIVETQAKTCKDNEVSLLYCAYPHSLAGILH